VTGLTTAPPSTAWTRRASLQALAAACLPGAAFALEPPTEAVVLSLSGRLRMRNRGAEAAFDMPMLQALPQQRLITRTPWYAKARQFSGPLLRSVLSAAGAQGTLLRLKALNDYQVDMPWDDPQRFDVLLALSLDGQPMGVRDKGPLMVIYPFDAQPELRSAVYYSRSAWQLRSIEVL
jgi:hypothetical protein